MLGRDRKLPRGRGREKVALARSRFIKSDDLYKSGFFGTARFQRRPIRSPSREEQQHVDERNCTISTFHWRARKKNRKGHARRRQSLATEKGKIGNPSPTGLARARSYPNKPATRHCSTRPTECIPCLRRHPALLYCGNLAQ